MDVFLAYAQARFIKEQKEQVFKAYMADAAHYAPQGKYLQSRYLDLLERGEAMDPEEVLAHVVEKAGLVIT